MCSRCDDRQAKPCTRPPRLPASHAYRCPLWLPAQNLQYFFVRNQPLEPHAPCVLLLLPAHRPPFATSRVHRSRPRSSRMCVPWRRTLPMNQPLTAPPVPLAVLGAPRHDVPLPRRLRGAEREQQLSNHAFSTALLTPSPCHTQTKIRDTLNNLILKSPQNWQTSVRDAMSRSNAALVLTVSLATPGGTPLLPD
jgi:hypothetical protein